MLKEHNEKSRGTHRTVAAPRVSGLAEGIRRDQKEVPGSPPSKIHRSPQWDGDERTCFVCFVFVGIKPVQPIPTITVQSDVEVGGGARGSVVL